MAALITTQIPVQNFELIRDKICEILVTEFAGQDFMNGIKLTKVWKERFIPFNHTELPAVNVTFDQVPYDNHNPKTRRGENQYYIDVTFNSEHLGDSDDERGDKLASENCQRAAGIICYILSSPEYTYLWSTPGVVQGRLIDSIKIGRLSEKDSLHTITARVTFKVRANESVGDITGTSLEEINTQVKLDETDYGFFYQLIN